MADELAPPILNSLQRTDLRNCEKTIEKGCLTFVEVGKALAEIKAGNLYVETHKTFRAYCEKRWGFSDSRARQLIGGAEVVNTLKGTVTPGNGSSGGEGDSEDDPLPSEKQTRIIRRIPEEKQPEVWEAAVESAGGKQPTQAQVQAQVQETIAQAAEDDAAPLPDEPEETPEDIVIGHNRAIEAFCRGVMKAAKDRPDLELLDSKGRWDGYMRKIKQGLDTLRSAKAVVCPACKGEGCKQCEDFGYLPKIEAEGVK